MKAVLFVLLFALFAVSVEARRKGGFFRAIARVAAAPVLAPAFFLRHKVRGAVAVGRAIGGLFRRRRARRRAAIRAAIQASVAAPAPVFHGRCAHYKRALHACQRPCHGRRRRRRRCHRAIAACQAQANVRLAACRSRRRGGRRCRRFRRAVAACQRPCHGRRRRRRRCHRAIAACTAQANAALAACRAGRRHVHVHRHRCHAQMAAIQACNRRCRGRRRRRRRCHAQIRQCQAVAQASLAQCMAPAVSVPTAPPHRCAAQMRLLNSCQRKCYGKRRCRKNRRKCKRAAKRALRSCMRPVTLAPVTAAPVDKCAAKVARLAACTTHHCRKKANRRLRRCRGIPARRRRNRRIRRIIRRARRRAVVVPCAVQIAAVAACTTHHCRKKANRRLRRCRGIPPRRRTIPRPLPAVKPVPCARKIRALARCTTRKCRKAARRALRRCRGLPRRKRRIVRRVVTRRPAHVCDRQRIRLARCTSRKCRIIQRCAYRRCHCHGGVRRLVKILKIAQRRACLCGDVDSDCVDRRYKKVMAIKKRISREKSVCRRKEHKSCRAARRVKRIIRRQIKAKKIVPKRKRVCGHRNKLARASMRRFKVRRTSLFAAVKRCGDEEPRCAQRLLKKVLLINSKIRLLAKRCKIVLPKLKKRPLRRIVRKLRTCGKHIYSDSWRNEVACPNINSNFKRWVRFWNCRRRVLFAEHKRCSPLDLSCQRFAFVQIIHIHRRLRQGRNDVTELLNTCNDCYPLRMQFRRWLRRQQARRRRFHRRILRCRNKDIPCQARNVEQIRVIQANIRTRRAHVIAMHAQCQQRGGTQNGFMQTYMQNVQVHTAAAESETISRLMSSASSIGVSVIAIVLAILVVM